METPALLLIVKVSLLLGAALAAAWVTRSAPARSRHRLWSGVFAAVLLLPLLTAAVPALRVPMPSWAAAPRDEAPVAPMVLVNVDAQDSSPEAPLPQMAPASFSKPLEAARPSLSYAQIGALLWIAGVIAALAALAVALVRVSRLARAAAPIADPEWTDAAAAIAARLGLRADVRLLTGSGVATPMAGGFMRPTIFLPASASSWTAEQRDVVLAHEIAHIAERDPLRQLLSRIALSIYWFHPLAWLAARQSAMAREQACDERVLALGTRPSTYARVLLDFAEGAAPSTAHLAALPIVQRSTLEKRLMAILNDTARPATRRVALVFAALAALTLSVAAAQPALVDQISGQVEQSLAGGVASGVPGGVLGGVQQGIAGGVQQGIAGGVQQGSGSGIGAGSGAGIGAGGGFGGGSGIGTGAGIGDGAGSGAGSGSGSGIGIGVAGGIELGQQWNDCNLGSITNFSGSMSSSRGRVDEAVGRRNYDFVMQKRFGDMLICALAENVPTELPVHVRDWPQAARRLVLETRESGDTRRMVIEGSRVEWSVNGQSRPVDAGANEWRQRLMELIEPVWELSRLRGEESSLRGQISSVHGQRSSLQGQISSLRGRVSSMQGEISSWQGRESSLRGEISSIRGQLSSMQGRISSEQGAISSLESRRWNASDAERDRIARQVEDHRARIRQIEADIRNFDVDARVREVEQRLAKLRVDDEIAEVEKRLRAFDVEKQVREVEKRIAELDVEKQVRGYEREIAELDVDRRSRDLEARIDAALKRLRSVR